MATNGNGAGQPVDEGATGRALAINAQYIKDLSFENPKAPNSLMQQQAPEVALNVDVKVQNLAPNVYEVLLLTQASASANGETIFVIDLTYGAVITLSNVEPEALPLALLIEAPRLLFPFSRSIIATLTREGGFPPLLLNPIDFGELLRRQQEQAAQAAAANA